MAVSSKRCPRCGASSPLTAPVCVRCGTPFGAVAASPKRVAVATSAQAAAAARPPAGYYPYAVAPASAGGLAKLSETRLLLIAGGILALGCLVVIAVVYLLTPHAVTPCRFDCGPAIGTRLPAPASIPIDQFGLEVSYPASWGVLQRSGDTVRLGSKAGEVMVHAERAGKSADQLSQDAIASLPSSSWQGISPLGPILGSHIGFQDGPGTVFSANFYPAQGQKEEMRIAVITATRGQVSVVFMAWNPYQQPDRGRDQSGIPESQLFDYVLNEFHWSGG